MGVSQSVMSVVPLLACIPTVLKSSRNMARPEALPGKGLYLLKEKSTFKQNGLKKRNEEWDCPLCEQIE